MRVAVDDGRTVVELEEYSDLLAVRALPDYRFVGPSSVVVDPLHLVEAGIAYGDDLVEIPEMAGHLFDYQRWVVERAFRRERFAAFMLTGLGKTAVQLEWARLVAEVSAGRVLIVAPLQVCHQTIGEAARFYPSKHRFRDTGPALCADCDGPAGAECHWVDAERSDIVRSTAKHLEVVDATSRDALDEWLAFGDGVAITNYEKLDGTAEPLDVAGAVLDESSMLRSIAGPRKWSVLRAFGGVRYKLACSATPAPNDRTEYAQHAVFLGQVRATKEYLTAYFRNDGKGNWDFKTHAFDAWVANLASWAVFMHDPARWRFDALPDMPALVESFPQVDLTDAQRERSFRYESGDQASLFGATPGGITSRTKLQQISNGFELVGDTIDWFPAEKPDAVVDIVRDHEDEQVIVWVHFDAEGDQLEHLLVNATVDVVHLNGKVPIPKRNAVIDAFRAGDGPRVLILKPAIKQATFLADAEALEAAVVARLRPLDTSEVRTVDAAPKIELEREHRPDWTLVWADAVAHLPTMQPASVGLAVFSPPFPALFAYSKELGDVANVRGTAADTSEHRLVWRWFAEALLPAMRPGRIAAIHCKEIIQPANIHGHRWCYDYPSELREGMEAAGWHYHRRITIAKNPQSEATRNKETSLLHVTVRRNALESMPQAGEYLLVFRAPGEPDEPVPVNDIDFETWCAWANSIWPDWAAPTWSGIRETDVLNTAVAKEHPDERHVCPLQLGLIERVVRLWSNPGDLVLSPFAGIGSEGHEALRWRRRFYGIELKESYYRTALRNLEAVTAQRDSHLSLFEEETASA